MRPPAWHGNQQYLELRLRRPRGNQSGTSMATLAPLTRAERLYRLASRVYRIAESESVPCRSHIRYEHNADEAWEIQQELKAIYR